MAGTDTSGTGAQDAPGVDDVMPGGTGPDEAGGQPGGGDDGVGTQPGAIDSADEVDPQRFDAG